jgi:NitT/TauT family transport system substrate-binding protein
MTFAPHQGRIDMTTRRNLIAGAAAAGLCAAAIPKPALAQAVKMRIGFLPVIPSDAHIGLADHFGYWKEEGLEPEFIRFSNGVEQFQALVGGSLDVLSAGAALANFPARGQGKVFLGSFLERASTQLWIRPDQGIVKLADLRGKKIATARGTTAELFLGHALESAGLDMAKDVEVVNQTIPNAVSAFISGAVPAVALWTPFDVQVKRRLPGATKLIDAGALFPKTAVLDGWAAGNQYFERNKDALKRLIRVFAKANAYLVANQQAALDILFRTRYQSITREEVEAMLVALTPYSNADWRRIYQDGTVAGWLNQTTDFFARTGGIANPLKAEAYFDPSLFLEAVPA